MLLWLDSFHQVEVFMRAQVFVVFINGPQAPQTVLGIEYISNKTGE